MQRQEMSAQSPEDDVTETMMTRSLQVDDDDVYYYIGERLKLEGETENSGV